METDNLPGGRASHSVRARALFCTLVVILGVYVSAAVVYNLPDSTVRSRALPAVTAVMYPWFQQDWKFFAPPPTSHSRLMVSARILGSDGTITETEPVDMQYPTEDEAKANHLLPSKVPCTVMTGHEAMTQYAGELARIRKEPADLQRRLHSELDVEYQVDLSKLARIMSRFMEDRHPGAQIVAVRGAFTDTPMVPFSERHIDHRPPEPTETVVTTSWAPFVPGLGG